MARLLVFFGVSIFFKVFSLKLECVLKLFLNIEGPILWYHALRSSKEVFCTVKKVLCEISQYSQENTYAVPSIIKLHVVATLLKKTPALVFFCEFTKLDWIPFLCNTSPWLLLFTRVSAEKVANYLFDHAEYEYNSDQTLWNARAYCYE